MKNAHLLTVVVLFLFQQTKAQPFERVERQSGLIDTYDNNGVAIADVNLDGHPDIYVVTRANFGNSDEIRSDKLFINNNDGTFTDHTATFGLLTDATNSAGLPTGLRTELGASFGDYNNDGYPDLFLSSFGHLQLYQNINGQYFQERTSEAGFPAFDECQYTTATWWDYNSDGFLDLFIADFNGCSTNNLWKNNGDGTFSDVTDAAKIGGNKENEACWMGMPIDVDGDQDLDLFVSVDFSEPNQLHINNGDGTFVESAEAFDVTDPFKEGMGIAVGDYDRDGLFDIYITNILQSTLFKNTGRNSFENVSQTNGVTQTDWAWGTQFGDFDHDLDEDLMVVNGYGSVVENFYYQNQLTNGSSGFLNKTKSVGLGDPSESNALIAFDYDHDGDLDLLFSNTNDHLRLIQNNTMESGNENTHWLKVSLEGIVSNRNAFGSILELITTTDTLYRYHHGASILSHSILPVHFGLGSNKLIRSLKIKWPSGATTELTDLLVDKHINVDESGVLTVLDYKANKRFGCTDIKSCNYDPNATFNDGSCEYLKHYPIAGVANAGNLSTEVYTYPAEAGTSYQWSVSGGELLDGEETNSITVKWGISGSGEVRLVTFNGCYSKEISLNIQLNPKQLNEGHSIARLWNEVLLEAIRKDYARPTVHSRNLFHMAVAMYDAWAIYHPELAQTYLVGNQVGEYINNFEGFETDEDPEEAMNQTISYAAYRVLSYRFAHSPHKEETQALFDGLMERLGYDTEISSTSAYVFGSPIALGNYIGQSVIDFGKSDHSREETKYDNAYYKSINPPLAPIFPGNPSITNPNRWQPLSLSRFIDQAGNPVDETTPKFLSPEWGEVTPFALKPSDKTTYQRDDYGYQVFHDPGHPPHLDTAIATSESALYQWNFSLVSAWSSHLDPTDGVMWDISPAKLGNIPFIQLPTDKATYPNFYNLLDGGDISQGHSINPVTNKTYTSQMVPRGDYTRVLAEFWADGPDSETPPGHWFTLLNYVTDHPDLEKRFEGKGTILSDLEWDVKAYFLLGGAMHDAAITAWGIKGWYDYIRPISAIRYMADKGQSSDPTKPNYHVAGLPLQPGFIELVEAGDTLAGNENEHVGKIKVYAWRGHEHIRNTATDKAGVGWILAENWWPYQRPSFVTPPFAGYVSGHSTYSRAAAELLTQLTGSDYFPGGMGEFKTKKNEFLVFEEGPSQDVTLQWATYRDASDQCSLSRIWGGIHPPADDLPGRIIGHKIGHESFDFGKAYFAPKPLTTKDLSKPFILFPNPIGTDGILIIMNWSGSAEFQLLNIDGKQISTLQSSFDRQSKRLKIQLPELPAGLYLFQSNDFKTKFVVKD